MITTAGATPTVVAIRAVTPVVIRGVTPAVNLVATTDAIADVGARDPVLDVMVAVVVTRLDSIDLTGPAIVFPKLLLIGTTRTRFSLETFPSIALRVRLTVFSRISM